MLSPAADAAASVAEYASFREARAAEERAELYAYLENVEIEDISHLFDDNSPEYLEMRADQIAEQVELGPDGFFAVEAAEKFRSNPSSRLSIDRLLSIWFSDYLPRHVTRDDVIKAMDSCGFERAGDAYCVDDMVDVRRAERKRVAVEWGARAKAEAERNKARDLEWEEAQRRASPSSLPSFPVQALPPVLRDFVVATAEYTQTPVDMAGMLSLGVCSAAIAGKMDIDVGWIEPLNLFAVMSAPPAERKSPVFKECLRPLRQCERDAIEKAASTIATVQTDRDLIVSQIKKKKDELLKLSPFDVVQEYQVNKCGPASGGLAIREELRTLESKLLKTVVPAAPRFLADDVTMEKLASLMAEQGGRMCVASAEGTLFGIIAGRYSRNGQGSFEVLLKGHAGEPLTVDRQSKDCPAVHMESACLTLVLAVQPSIIKGLSANSNMKGQGLLARFLYSLPTSRVGSRSIGAARIPKAASDGYRDVVRSLTAVPTLAERIAMGDGSRDIADQFGIAPALTLSAEALAMFQELRLETEKRLIGDLADMADWAGKWCGAVGRIAGILHCAEFGPAGDVSGATMRSAIAIGRYLIEHARAAFGLMSTDALEEDSAAVIAWATRTKRTQFTMRELSRLGPREVVRDKKRRVAVVEALYDLGRVELNGTTFTLT